MPCEAVHRPVLRAEVVRLLCPAGRRVLVDCTVGLGGHAEALLSAAEPDALLIGIDLDENNLRIAGDRLARFGGRVRLFHANFSELPDVLAQAEAGAADAILADLGACSAQLDDPARGFGFSRAGPLDMRMDRRIEQTAGGLVNSLSERQLADLIYTCGGERYSRRIARAIVEARRERAIDQTVQLAGIVARAYPPAARRSRRGVHPATRTFQALRIAVNDELGSLDRLLATLPDALAGGARAAFISFHSLEDRRIKHAFADLARSGRAKLLTKKPITPTAEEIRENPRSRSAKLRGLERVA